ncbi:MAG: hypothetical protein IT565_06295 [Rhodospirillales bacterium]|nr:hypothetical protein [Rhodospirillales bacterium]
MSFLSDPVVQTSLLPLLTALVAAGVLGLVGGGDRGKRLAGGGAALAFLVTYAVILGWPAFPPQGAMAKTGWSLAAGLVLALVIDAKRPLDRFGLILMAAWLAASALWIFAAALSAPAGADLLRFVLWAAAAVLIMRRLASLGPDPAPAALMGLHLSIALGAVALIGASASIGQLGLAGAATLGGFLLVNWPKARHQPGAGLLLAAAGAPLLLALVLVQFGPARTPSWCLLAALPLLWADRVADRLGIANRALGIVALGFLAALPMAVAVGLAFFVSPDATSGY